MEYASVAIVMALIAWFYLWTANAEGRKQALSAEGGGYFNLVARGFSKGQLSMDLAADPALATLKNPYDSGERAGRGLHDASYFKGKYYLYFGATPIVILFLPFHFFTGWYIEEWCSVLVFSLVGFIVAVAILQRIRRLYFPAAGTWSVLAGVMASGMATMVPALLRRPDVWEVPIACAYAMFMLTLWCILRSLEAGKHARTWLALGSLAMGLCIGARPVYLFGAVVLLAPLAATMGNFTTAGWRRAGWKMVFCALGPIAAVGVMLAAYNYFRFGSVTEFGWTYQMAGDDNSSSKMLSASVVWFNIRLYLFSAAGLSPFFPFVTVITPPPVPVGQLGMEDPYGLVPNLPWVLLALPAAWMALRGQSERSLRWFVGGALAATIATFLMVCCFRGAAGRYLVDFAPGFVLLGGIGAFQLVSFESSRIRTLAGAIVAGLLAWSTAFGLLSSLQHNQLLRAEHPEVYARVAHRFNQIPQLIDRACGSEYGPVELTVVFPRGVPGQVEPLVATGRAFLADYVYVHYLSDEEVRFGFEHTSRTQAVGETTRIVPGSTHTLRIYMGSLYPPRAHPYFDSLSSASVRLRTRTLRVMLDGRTVLHRSTEFYDAAEKVPSFGTSGGRPGFPRDFSGSFLGWKRFADEPFGLPGTQTGPLALTIKFPPFTGVRSEPLLSSGETGRGDLVYLRYEDANHLSFGHDHWSVGGAHSAPVEFDPAKEHVIELSCPPLLGPGAKPGLIVRFDGHEVFAPSTSFYPCDPDTVSVGENEIHSSAAEMMFGGDILKAERKVP